MKHLRRERTRPEIGVAGRRPAGSFLLAALLLLACLLPSPSRAVESSGETCTSVATLDCVQFLGRDVCTVWEEAGGTFDSPLRQVVDYRRTELMGGGSETDLITAGGDVVAVVEVLDSGPSRLLAETLNDGRTVTIDLNGNQLTLSEGATSVSAQKPGGPMGGAGSGEWTVSAGFDAFLARHSQELFLAQIALRKDESVYAARETLGFFEGAGAEDPTPPSMPSDCTLLGASGLRGGYIALNDDEAGQPIRMVFVDHLGEALAYDISLPGSGSSYPSVTISSSTGTTELTLSPPPGIAAGNDPVWHQNPPGSLAQVFQSPQTEKNARLLYDAASPGGGGEAEAPGSGGPSALIAGIPSAPFLSQPLFSQEGGRQGGLEAISGRARLHECRPGCQLPPLDNLIIDDGDTEPLWSSGHSSANCISRLNYHLEEKCEEISGLPGFEEFSSSCHSFKPPLVTCAALPGEKEIVCHCRGQANLARYSVCDGRSRAHQVPNPSTTGCCETHCPCPSGGSSCEDPGESFTCQRQNPAPGDPACQDFRHQACQLDPTFCGTRHQDDPTCVVTGYHVISDIIRETSGRAERVRRIRVQVFCDYSGGAGLSTAQPGSDSPFEQVAATASGDWQGDGPTVYFRPGALDEAPVSGSVEVQVVARDDVLGISHLAFWVDGQPVQLQGLQRRVHDPYTCSEVPGPDCDPNSRWVGHLDTSNLSPGPHRLDVVAFNRRGTPGPLYGYNWQGFTVAEGGCSDTERPTVSISTPAPNATVSGAVSVEASAADNGSISVVTFFVDGERQLGQDDSTAPYTFSWDSSQWADGEHTLEARAYDGCGNNRLSAPVTVTTDNSPNRELRFLPGDDAWIGEDPQHADDNFGWANFLRVRTDLTGEGRLSFLRFRITGTGGSQIAGARLRLRTQEQLVRSVRVFKAPVIGAWDEDTLSWNNQPAYTTQLVGEAPFLSPDEWHEIDLGTAVTGDGNLHLILDSTRQTGLQDMWSKESVIYQPELIVVLED